MGELQNTVLAGEQRSTSPEEQTWLRQVAYAPSVTPAPSGHGQPAAAPPLAEGDCVGAYRVIGTLGRGGMGMVFSAVHETIGKRAAIKVLHHASAADEQARRRFLNEARAASSVEHPSVVHVFDFGHLPSGEPYLLMEHVEGETLRARLQREGTLSCLKAVRTARQIASALSAVHACGIRHRDLKPDNVLLVGAEKDGEEERVKVLDFGIALLGDGSDRITSETRVLGTPAYMSPEQCAPGAPLDGSCDVYALGVMLFEALIGEPPFQGGAAAVLHLQCAARPPLWKLARRAPDRLIGLIDRMLAKDPAVRPAGEALPDELRSIEEALASGTSSPRLRASLAATLPRLPALASAARMGSHAKMLGLVLVAPLAAVLLTMYMRRRPDRPLASLSDMRWLPGGGYRQGREPSEIDEECRKLGASCRQAILEAEQPAREVHVSPFYLDMHEVTNADYARMLNSTPPEFRVVEDTEHKLMRFVQLRATGRLLLDLWTPASGVRWDGKAFHAREGYERLPVVQVTWDGADFYCKTHGKRLPSEAEWEFAARGPEGRRFPWGDREPVCDELVFGRDAGQPCAQRPRQPAAVGVTQADRTPDGIMDLGGNVMEWADDVSRLPYHAPCGACIDPRVEWAGPIEQDFRVVRGAAWSNTVYLHASARGRWRRTAVADDLGFRCATNDER